MLNRIQWILAFALLTGPLMATAQSNEQQKMAEAIERRVASGQFTGTVLVSHGSKLILNRGFGLANREWQVPNSVDTRFRIASLTKQFTAAGILLLAEQGKLRLEDPVNRYVPDAPAAWSSITILHLLTHTSGIPDLTTFSDFLETARRPTTPEKLVASFYSKALKFVPGADFSYTNSGYIVLGLIIEIISGRSYADFVRENLFMPLGMTSSGYDSNSEVLERRAHGYVRRATGVRVADYLDMSVPFSAGGLYSTTGDLLRWEQGLFGGRLLSASSLKKMTQPFKGNYGFGVAVDTDAHGHSVVWHGGSIDGFSTFMAYAPAEKLTVVVLANLENAPAKAMAGELLGLAGHGVAGISGSGAAAGP